MRRKSLAIAALSLLMPCFASVCSAQIVVVRPGYVQAPFVRVYTRPDGSSHVRAPFVDVHSPPRRPLGYYSRGELVASPGNMADLDWQPLRRVLRQSAGDFDAQLRRFPTGNVWRSHFQSEAIPNLVGPATAGAPTPSERAALVDVLRTFDEATKSPDLREITRLYTFQVVHAALREFTTPAELRMRRQLAASNRDLHLALDGLRTGASWQKYLALPAGAAERSGTQPKSPLALSEADILELTTLLDRYDSVNSNPEYRGVARLAPFQATHRRLQSYVDSIAEQPMHPGGGAIEELPAPKPQ